jgi:hypothetical protein
MKQTRRLKMDYTVKKLSSKVRVFGGVYAENDYMATTTDLVFVAFGKTSEEAVENLKMKLPKEE